jgi:hypothetical protein
MFARKRAVLGRRVRGRKSCHCSLFSCFSCCSAAADFMAIKVGITGVAAWASSVFCSSSSSSGRCSDGRGSAVRPSYSGALASQPCQVDDLVAAKELWSRPIRETNYLGPFPGRRANTSAR